MPDLGDSLRIENVVGVSGIDQEIDLQAVASDLDNAEYEPKNFPGVIVRIKDPKATCLLFRSGKIVSTGAATIDDVHLAVETLTKDITELGIEVPDSVEITIQNIVASGDLGQPLNLNAIAIGLGLENVEYEPEQFPGLVYRMDDPSVAVLLFNSGKTVITGGQTVDAPKTAILRVGERLEELGLLTE